MLWGAFSSDGVCELVWCDKSINAKEYEKVLENGWLPSIHTLFSQQERSEVIFQQDNAPALTAKATKKLLQRKSLKLKFWPGQSPDLNSFENIPNSAQVRQKVSSSHQLWEAIKHY